MSFHGLEFLLGIALGVAALYFFIKLRSKRKALQSALYKRRIPSKNKTNATALNPVEDMVKAGEVSAGDNLKTEVILDVDAVLAMLNEYLTNPNAALLEELQHELQKHDEEGNNMLHEYLSHEHAEVETVEHMVEIEHELMTEHNEHGETALHTAVHHNHFEIAEWLSEAHHYHSAHEHHHVLSHHDHHGHTALHDAAHEWHYHPHEEHFLHMVGDHPFGSLLWKDGEGKTVLENFLENPEANKKALLEALEHKGVIHKHGNHYEFSHEAEGHIQDAHHANKATSHLNELLVKHYSPTHHTNTAPPTSENVHKQHEQPKEGKHPHTPHNPHPH